MSLLHAHFNLRNQQAFQRTLEASRSHALSSSNNALSSSGGRSWTKPSVLTSNTPVVEVNARDTLGRTVLHLACASSEPSALEYVRLLLAHPAINVNLQDNESHWTPLHRSLYYGNIGACVSLLQRNDLDLAIRDYEGLTAFDLYNSTVKGTQPSDTDEAYLVSWGTNRNSTLGVGDGSDRTHPEHVHIRPSGMANHHASSTYERFKAISVKDVQMSKLHTVILTDEQRSNARLCGFGSGGRLGSTVHSQSTFGPVPGLNNMIVSVALGQDHTLVLTGEGEVLSWGMNRFLQLGYHIEGVSPSEHVQLSPHKIYGPLKKEFVRGIAACRTASACFTAKDVYTWGTNSGQLGYPRTSHIAQPTPRKVTGITTPVMSIALNDTAMAYILSNQEVHCYWNSTHTKINFSSRTSEISYYRPPQKVNRSITKLTTVDGAFAALSASGDVFTFSMTAEDFSERGLNIKPQRVWTNQRQGSAVKDVALGDDGTIILCTASGHVFIRSRSKAGALGKLKFQRVPFIQRVTRVTASVTGAFAALRSVSNIPPLDTGRSSFVRHIAGLQPYLAANVNRVSSAGDSEQEHLSPLDGETGSDDEGEQDALVQRDIQYLVRLCVYITQSAKSDSSLSLVDVNGSSLPNGADTVIECGQTRIPGHRALILARCPGIHGVWAGKRLAREKFSLKLQSASSKVHVLRATGIHPLSLLIALTYLYTDNVLFLWDRRIGSVIESHLKGIKAKVLNIVQDLQNFARLFDLTPLLEASNLPVKRPCPSMLTRDLALLFERVQTHLPSKDPLRADAVIELADHRIYCHSYLLQARSPFFAALFGDNVWTEKRWLADETVVIDMMHIPWRTMSFVIRYLCYGDEDDKLFSFIDDLDNLDQLIDFLFEVLAVASELLLDPLIALCTNTIIKFVNYTNVCAVLLDAIHWYASELVERLEIYIAENLEGLLEGHFLEDLPPAAIKHLSDTVRANQQKLQPFTRSDLHVKAVLNKWREWLAQQDIPSTLIPNFSRISTPLKGSPKLSPQSPIRTSRRTSGQICASSPPHESSIPHTRSISRTQSRSQIKHDDIFAMDEADGIPPLNIGAPQIAGSGSTPPRVEGSGVWRSKAPRPATKTDLRSIIAEAETERQRPARTRVVGFMPEAGPSRRAELSTSSVNAAQTPAGSPSTKQPVPSPKIVRSPPNTPTVSGLSQALHITPVRRQVSSSSTAAVPNKRNVFAEGPTMGPTYAPTRTTQPVADSSSSGAAWTSARRPTTPPTSPTPLKSFAAIQEQQRAASESPKQIRRSMKDIQAEEEAKQQEDQFLRWWAAEEERLRLEAAGTGNCVHTSKQATRGGRPSRGTRRRGKAAGHRKADDAS